MRRATSSRTPVATGDVSPVVASKAALLISCLERYREHVQTRPAEPLRLVSPADCAAEPSGEEVVQELLRDPIRSALRGRVRDIGWQAFAQGGSAKMHRLAERVEAQTSGTFIVSTLDKWWNGIGGGGWEWTS